MVATVSCIYGLGSPAEYLRKAIELLPGQELERDTFLRQLVDMQYVRNDFQAKRGHFRVRGDVVEVQPAYDDRVLRIVFGVNALLLLALGIFWSPLMGWCQRAFA